MGGIFPPIDIVTQKKTEEKMRTITNADSYCNYGFEDFASITEFQNVIKGRKLNAAFAKKYPDGCETYSQYEVAEGDSFFGTKDFSEANDTLKYGYAKGCEGLKSLEGIKPCTRIQRPRMVSSVAGFMPNVPAALQGRPDAMYTTVKGREIKVKANKVITIVYDVSQSYGTSSDTILYDGKRILAVLQSLENEGYRVNLKVMICSTCSSTSKTIRRGAFIKIKDAGEKLNLMAVAYPLAHASMLRRHFLRWMETSPVTSYKGFTYSYGSVPTLTNDLLHEKGILGRNEYYFSGSVMSTHKSVKELVDYAKQVLGV